MARTQKQVVAPHSPQARQDAPSAGGTDTRTMLPIASIDPNPWNPRRFPKRPDPDDHSLTASIAQFGVLQNVLARPMPHGRYQLIFGERRLRSATAARLTEIPATVRQMDDHEARVLTVAENLHHKQLHFLDEAAGVAALIEEHWTADRIAAKLSKPLSWVARRHRLLNLTPGWRKLAETQEGWTANWRDRHFEQIALLEATAQEELLEHNRDQLERCATVGDLSRLIGSRTRTLSSFPWPLDDAELDPLAGACSACPHRSSRHPGLFDDQEVSADDHGAAKSRGARRSARGEGADRCLNPLCAANKGVLLVARTKAELAARNPDVLLLQDGYLPQQIPGALRFHQVEPAKKGAPGAVAAVVANGPHLGKVKWVRPRHELSHRAAKRPADVPPPHRPLAERQEQKWRQRKVHAIGLLKTALIEQPPPALLISVRLAVVFGTAQSHASSAHSFDTALPRVAAGADPAAERRRMLGHRAGTPAIDAWADPPTGDPATPDIDDTADDEASQEGPFWRTFDALEGKDDAVSGYLWARTLPVMIDRMTPNGDWRHVPVAWREAERVAGLVGLRAQEFLDLATTALPDPKSWAKELRLAKPTPPATPSQPANEPRPTGKGTSRTPRGSSCRALPAAPRLVASRLPR